MLTEKDLRTHINLANAICRWAQQQKGKRFKTYDVVAHLSINTYIAMKAEIMQVECLLFPGQQLPLPKQILDARSILESLTLVTHVGWPNNFFEIKERDNDGTTG